MSDGYDIVHTITDWYDGARAGVANLNGQPHYYECAWRHKDDDWSEVCLLTPIDEETFAFAMEDWQIWKRWRAAFDKGQVDIESHPALPAEQSRHQELSNFLASRLVIGDSPIKAKGEFKYGEPTRVKWTIVS